MAAKDEWVKIEVVTGVQQLVSGLVFLRAELLLPRGSKIVAMEPVTVEMSELQHSLTRPGARKTP